MTGEKREPAPEVLRVLEGLVFRARYLVEGYLSGIQRSPFHGGSVEFSEYRDYRAGDDLRRVDWRHYGRSDRLYSKRYEQDTEARVLLVLDRSASMAYRGDRAWDSKAGCAQTLAAAMGWLLAGQQDPVGVLALEPGNAAGPVRYWEPSRRSERISEALTGLERLPVAGGTQIGTLLEAAFRLMRRRGVVLVFSDFLDPEEEWSEGLKRLRYAGHELVAFQCLDPDELDFPFAEEGWFVDPETGLSRQVRPEQARDVYLERMGRFLEAQREFFGMHRIGHSVFRGDEDPGVRLAQFLGRRRGSK